MRLDVHKRMMSQVNQVTSREFKHIEHIIKGKTGKARVIKLNCEWPAIDLAKLGAECQGHCTGVLCKSYFILI